MAGTFAAPDLISAPMQSQSWSTTGRGRCRPSPGTKGAFTDGVVVLPRYAILARRQCNAVDKISLNGPADRGLAPAITEFEPEKTHE
jgi:hypothetical protein